MNIKVVFHFSLRLFAEQLLDVVCCGVICVSFHSVGGKLLFHRASFSLLYESNIPCAEYRCVYILQ